MQPVNRRISIVTYNIHKGFGIGKVRFLLPEMKAALADINPDIIFLQEVQGAHRHREKRIEDWPDSPQFEYIAESFWPHYLYAKNAIYDAGHHGNAILSKYPFSSFENINLSFHNRASRSLLHGQIQWGEEESQVLHVLCVHLGLFKAERAEQCKMLIERIQEAIPLNQPLVMAGDFNDWRIDLSKPLEEALGLNEAFYCLEGQHARSFPAIKPALCVDRIYFRGLNILDVQCLDGKPWRMLSDHVPLSARFELE
jgi:endonuclease/exonuclease/phosphatase family metal-dependent hydrolase